MKIKTILVGCLLITGLHSTLFSGDCSKDSDCRVTVWDQCWCEGRYVNGDCWHSVSSNECCSCQQ